MKEKKSLFLVFFIIFVVVINLLSASSVMAQRSIKIAVLPFEIFSERSAAELEKQLHSNLMSDLLKTQVFQIAPREQYAAFIVNKKIDEKLARLVGDKVGADLAIFGSLTQLGNAFSIDAKVLQVKDDKPLQHVFVQGRGLENLSRLTRQLTDKIVVIGAGERKIAAIHVKGSRKIEASAVLNIVKSTKGMNFSEAELNNDIKSIYKMGYFDNVSADVEDTPQGKVITFLVQEKPTIVEVNYTGNKEIKSKEIEEAIATKPHQLINMEKLRSDVEKIRGLYSNKGYLDADISWETKAKNEREVIVTFKIVEHERQYIKKISFEGNQAFSQKELRNLMETKEKGIFHWFTDSGLLKSDKLNEDVNRLTVFYLNNGYINARIGNPEIKATKTGIQIKIAILEGKRFKVGKVDVAGDLPAIPKAQLMKKLKIPKQDHYDREVIMKDMDFLTQTVNDEGYAYADVVPEAVTHDKEQLVDITYQITKNDKVYFNKITVSGNTKTRDKVVRRELSIAEGELYSRGALKDSYTKLNKLKYFEEIDFQAEKGPDKDLMDINIRVKERPTGSFTLGAGYSAVNGAVLSGAISQENLFGRGQTLGFQTAFGTKYTSFNISFIEPWLFDIPLWSKYELWTMRTTYDTYDLRSKGFGFTFGYPIWGKIVGYAGYRLSIDDVTDIEDSASSYIKRQEGETTTSSITLTLGRDTTDDNMFPSKGSRNSVGVEYAGGPLQGDSSFAKYTATTAWFFPLPKDNVFGIKGRIGYLQELEGKDAPVWTRFYVGGINSIRGVRQVGPLDPATGDVIGGVTMIVINAEVVFPIVKSAGLKGVVFFDTGNAWSSGYHLDDMRRTVGLGIRWFSPMGPLRLEWGYVLDKKEHESSNRLEFTIGYFM